MKLIMDVALSQIGIKETIGFASNREIIKYFTTMGHSEKAVTDETAWCSVFASWCCHTSGLEHSTKLNARSWMKVGVPTDTPSMGDIVVFWRVSRDDWRGHVGFYVREDKDYIYVLGGNQSNKVCIKPYPKHRLLGYRKLRPNG